MNEGQYFGFVTNELHICSYASYEDAIEAKKSYPNGSNIISKGTQAELIAYLNASLEPQVKFREYALNAK